MSAPNTQPRKDGARPPMSNKNRKFVVKLILAREAVEQEAARQVEIAQPEYPISEFCFDVGVIPTRTNWGFSTDRDLSIVIPSPNDKLERVNDVPLAKGYTWAALASAVEDAACNEGSGGMICSVKKVKVAANRKTLEVEFDIYAFREDNSQEGQVSLQIV